MPKASPLACLYHQSTHSPHPAHGAPGLVFLAQQARPRQAWLQLYPDVYALFHKPRRTHLKPYLPCHSFLCTCVYAQRRISPALPCLPAIITPHLPPPCQDPILFHSLPCRPADLILSPPDLSLPDAVCNTCLYCCSRVSIEGLERKNKLAAQNATGAVLPKARAGRVHLGVQLSGWIDTSVPHPFLLVVTAPLGICGYGATAAVQAAPGGTAAGGIMSTTCQER